MRPTADVQRRLAYERQKPIFLQHYKDYLFENAQQQIMHNSDIDTYIYSLGDFDLQAHPVLNLVAIDTKRYGMLPQPQIGRRTLKAGLRREEVEPEKQKHQLKPDEVFGIEKTDEYYYTPGPVKGVDDTFNAAEWGNAAFVDVILSVKNDTSSVLRSVIQRVSWASPHQRRSGTTMRL